MLIKEDPAVLFPVVIGMEVLILFSIGANASGQINTLVLLLFCFTQLAVLTLWGGIIYRHLKSVFYKIFWTPIIAGLLLFNLVVFIKLSPAIIEFIATTILN